MVRLFHENIPDFIHSHNSPPSDLVNKVTMNGWEDGVHDVGVTAQLEVTRSKLSSDLGVTDNKNL